jgi:hypothetical protein
VEIRRMRVPSQPTHTQKKFSKLHLNRKGWHVPVIPATAESINRRIAVKANLGKKVKYYLKNSQSKKGWRHGSSSRARVSAKYHKQQEIK